MGRKNRSSVGVIITRKNCKGEFEFLVVRKRITYAFNDFVYGNYKTQKDVLGLFNQMTGNEKWYYISSYKWEVIFDHFANTKREDTDLYESLKKKFYKTFPSKESLLKLLKSSKSSSSLLWEFPKGHSKSHENTASAAVRECEEETGMVLGHHYHLATNIMYENTYVDGRRTWRQKYFIGVANDDITAFDMCPDYGELGNMQWKTLNELKFIDNFMGLVNMAQYARRFIKKFYAISK